MPSRLTLLPPLVLVLSLLALAQGLWLLARGPGPLPEVIELNNPTSAVLDQRGRLYVVDAGGTRLTALGRDGSFRWSRSAGTDPKDFSVVHGLALDRDDRLYLVDLVQNRVQRLSSQGQLEQVYSPAPTGKLLTFDAFDTPWLVSDHRLYLEVLPLDASGTASLRLPPVSTPALAAVGPHGEVSWADVEGRLWALRDAEWQPLPLPHVSRVGGLRYLDDGRLLVLDHPSQTWFTWKDGVLETVLAPLPSQRTWSPLASIAADGTLVVTQPYANKVFLNSWGRTTVEGAWVGLWSRILFPGAWTLVVLGALGGSASLLVVLRALARRALDLQIVQVALLVPLVMATVGWVHGNLEQRTQAQGDQQRLEALETVLGTMAADLASHPASFEELGAAGMSAGTLDYLQLIETTAQETRIVRAFPHGWIRGFETEVPAAANRLVPGETLSTTYDALWSRRHAAFARLGPGLVVEVGLEVTPVTRSAWTWLLWGLLSVVLTLGVGAYALARVAPRYALGRSLLAPFPTQPTSEPRDTRGVVIALRWPPEDRPGARPGWAQRVPALVEVCRPGARISALNSRGALVVYPATGFQGLEMARSLVRLEPRCVVLVEGEWSYQTRRWVDRTEPVPVGEAIDAAWALAQGEVGERGGFLVAGPLVDGLELPWRGLDPEGPVVQVLDPTLPSHRAALDYLAPHNEAFRAWGEGRLDEARRGFSFVAHRLPEDGVVLALLRRVTP